MALIRLRGLCEAGNVCPTLICDTDTGDALLQGPLDPAAAATLKAPDGEGVIRIPAEQVARCSTVSARTPALTPPAGRCSREPADRRPGR
ncbi:MAG: hypothetical protein LC799_35855 [Actinobacteria bacterium]|nr:hypothetical protein [Actinomycetota bacterium]